jgi:hypothetical protein
VEGADAEWQIEKADSSPLKRVRNDKVEGADAEWQIEKAASSPLKRIRNDKVDGSGFGMTNRRSRFLTAEADSE